MLLRKVLLAAVVVAPMAWSPATVSAQARGLDRAAAATAQADAVAGWTKNRAAKRPKSLPPGVARGFVGQTLPPGISRTRPAPEPAPEAEPDPTCEPGIVLVNGLPVLIECDGTP